MAVNPPITKSLIERFRLGLTVLGAYRVGDWHQLEDVPVEDWLVGLGGRGTFEKLWRPMLRAKFDGQFGETPATYIWSRLKRTSSPRAASSALGVRTLFSSACSAVKMWLSTAC